MRRVFILTLLCLVLTAGYSIWWAEPEKPDWSLVTPLHRAVQAGDVETVASLLAEGAPIDARTRIGETPLGLSLRHDDLTIARLLIENGADLGQPRLLYDAVFWGTEDTVRLLLEAGVDPRPENDEATGLHALGARGTLEMLEALLDAGAEINALDANGRTPIFRALSSADPAIVRRMIAEGADPAIADQDGLTPLQFVARYARPVAENIRLAVAAGADPNRRDADGNTPLHINARKGDAENARALVRAGADIEALDDDGATPLLVALKAGRLETVRALIELGASTEVRGVAGRTPLFYAAASENRDLMEFLLSTDPVVDQRDDGGATPLMMASAMRNVEVLVMVLDAGAAINARDDHDQTPLHYAARFADGPVVRALIARGADKQAVDRGGRKPWSLGFNNRRLRGDAGAFKMLEN